jgi:hypothetical protein
MSLFLRGFMLYGDIPDEERIATAINEVLSLGLIV